MKKELRATLDLTLRVRRKATVSVRLLDIRGGRGQSLFCPFHIVLTGRLTVVAKVGTTEVEMHTLRYGDAFGFSNFLNMVGPEDLGEIRATNDVTCLVITDPDQVIRLHEQALLREVGDNSNLKVLMEQRCPEVLN
jgi:hypothetical protein